MGSGRSAIRDPRKVRYVQLNITVVGGLHLTGVVQVGGPPRALRWRALQARRMSARRWRGARDLSWPLAGDDVLVAPPVPASRAPPHPPKTHPPPSPPPPPDNHT